MLHNRYGLEVDLHFLNVFTPDNVGENMFEVGPVVSLIHEDRMNLYVKAVGGIGRVDFKAPTFTNPHTETYGIYGIGGGIEFRATQRINIRAVDIEQEFWPGYKPRGLTPLAVTFGAAYRF